MNRQSRMAVTAAAIGAGVLAGTATAQELDPTLLDVLSKGGQVLSVTASSRYQNNDDPTKAFGNSTTSYEPEAFLFADLGAGTLNTITAIVDGAPTISGVRIEGGALGLLDPRRIGAVDVFVNGSSTPAASIADFPDTGDGGSGVHDFIFNAPVSINTLKIEAVNQDGNGLRLTEVDALVPEPTVLSLLSVAGFGLLARRRKA